MPKVKVAGVYMIRNTITGRVYIGESVDIKQRFAKYRWAVSSDKSYKETSVPKILRGSGKSVISCWRSLTLTRSSSKV